MAALAQRNQGAETEALPILPLWVEQDSPLQARRGREQSAGFGFWLRVIGTGVGAGFLIGGGYLGALAQLQHDAPRLIEVQASQTRGLQASNAQTLTSVPRPEMPTSVAPVQPVVFAPVLAPSPEQVVKAKPQSRPVRTKRARVAGAAKTVGLAAPVEASEQAAERPTAEVPAKRVHASIRKPARTATPNVVLPEQPSRGDVQKGLEQVRPQLAACSNGEHGLSYAKLTIVGSGRVSYSIVEGDFAGTPAGSCMARALRTATFPAFSGANFSVRYPFVF